MRRNGNINAEDQFGKTPLMFAARRGHEAVVRLLIECDNIDINAQDNARKTPLVHANKRGKEKSCAAAD